MSGKRYTEEFKVAAVKQVVERGQARYRGARHGWKAARSMATASYPTTCATSESDAASIAFTAYTLSGPTFADRIRQAQVQRRRRAIGGGAESSAAAI